MGGVWVHVHVRLEEKSLSSFCCCVWGSSLQQHQLHLHFHGAQHSLSEPSSCHVITGLHPKANVALKILT